VSAESYLLGWLVYLGALVCFLGCAWYLSRSWPKALRGPLRAGWAALLLLPWTVSAGSEHWAPAWLVTLLDGLIQVDTDAARAGWPLLTVVVLAVSLAAGEQLYRRYKGQG